MELANKYCVLWLYVSAASLKKIVASFLWLRSLS